MSRALPGRARARTSPSTRRTGDWSTPAAELGVRRKSGAGGRSDRRDAAGDGRARVAAACRSPRPRSATARPTMGDVDVGCVVEIKSGTTFVAERGAGLEIRTATANARAATSAPTPTSPACSGRSASAAARRCPLITVLGELIDASSVGGAVFDLGSATFDMTRLVTGQLDAYRRRRLAHDRGGARAASPVRAGRRRRGAEQLALRPRGGGPVPGGGGRRRHRRPRRAARRPAAARLGPRVPDVLRGGRQPGAARSASWSFVERGFARLADRD